MAIVTACPSRREHTVLYWLGTITCIVVCYGIDFRQYRLFVLVLIQAHALLRVMTSWLSYISIDDTLGMVKLYLLTYTLIVDVLTEYLLYTYCVSYCFRMTLWYLCSACSNNMFLCLQVFILYNRTHLNNIWIHSFIRVRSSR